MTTKENKVLSEPTEIEKLRAELAELRNQISKEKKPVKQPSEKTGEKIQLEDYIPVMSLLPYTLNLSTKEGGQGSTKKFTKFGEIKKILYKDLVDIIEVHKNFLDAGYFYIMDSRIVRNHGLDDVYSKILTKEKIEQILDTNSDESITLYESANEKQQNIIIELLVEKIKSNPDNVNLNMIDRLSRISKVNIMERVQLSKELEPVTAE